MIEVAFPADLGVTRLIYVYDGVHRRWSEVSRIIRLRIQVGLVKGLSYIGNNTSLQVSVHFRCQIEGVVS